MRNFTLDGEIELLGIRKLVVGPEGGSGRNGQVLIPDSRSSGRGNGERETLARVGWVLSSLVWFVHVNRDRADVEQAKRRITNLIKERKVLDRGVVKSSAHADACLSRTAKEFP